MKDAYYFILENYLKIVGCIIEILIFALIISFIYKINSEGKKYKDCFFNTLLYGIPYWAIIIGTTFYNRYEVFEWFTFFFPLVIYYLCYELHQKNKQYDALKKKYEEDTGNKLY